MPKQGRPSTSATINNTYAPRQETRHKYDATAYFTHTYTTNSLEVIRCPKSTLCLRECPQSGILRWSTSRKKPIEYSTPSMPWIERKNDVFNIHRCQNHHFWQINKQLYNKMTVILKNDTPTRIKRDHKAEQHEEPTSGRPPKWDLMSGLVRPWQKRDFRIL